LLEIVPDMYLNHALRFRTERWAIQISLHSRNPFRAFWTKIAVLGSHALDTRRTWLRATSTCLEPKTSVKKSSLRAEDDLNDAITEFFEVIWLDFETFERRKSQCGSAMDD
jgi:hypothetical protein